MFYLIINEVLFGILEGIFIFLMTSSITINDRKTYLNENKLKILLFIAIYAVFSFWITLSFPFGYHTLILSTFTGIILSVMFKNNIFISMLAVAITVVIIIITEHFLVISADILFNISINYIISNPSIKMVFSIIAKSVQITLATILFRSNLKPIFRARMKKLDTGLINYSVLGIYMMCIFLMSLNFIINNPKSSLKYQILLFAIFLIYIVFGILDFRDRIKLLNIQQKFTLQSEYINNLETMISIIRREKHDFANHLNAIHAICVINKPDAVERIRKYVDNLTEGLKTSYKIFDTGNVYIDGLLVVKSNYAYENNINLDVEVEAPLNLLNVVDNDLISVISNIMDNAFECLISSEKKDNRAVSMCTYIENNEYHISIANNGPKIPENIIDRIFDNGFSTKKQKTEHGLGLYIVKSLLKKYNGHIQVLSSDEETQFIMRFPIKDEYYEQHSQLVNHAY